MRSTVAMFFVSVLLVCAAAAMLPNVESQVISLTSGSGRVGAQIAVSGTGFLPTDTACSISSPSSAGVVMGAACVVQGGVLTGGFTVGNVSPGAYVIQATGSQGDSAQALLGVSGGAQIGLSPATGQPGMQVSVSGLGFLPTDLTCSLSSPSSPDPILPGTAACVIQEGSGTPSAGFTIGNVLPGEYLIQLTGSQGDSAQAIIDVA